MDLKEGIFSNSLHYGMITTKKFIVKKLSLK